VEKDKTAGWGHVKTNCGMDKKKVPLNWGGGVQQGTTGGVLLGKKIKKGKGRTKKKKMGRPGVK